MFDACKRTRVYLSRQTARSADEKIHFSLAALRGLRARHSQRVSDAVSCCSHLSRFFAMNPLTCRNLPALCEHIQHLQNVRLAELEKEADQVSESEIKARLRSRLQRRRELWRPLQKLISLGTILDPTGNPCSTIDQAGEELARHWEGVFGNFEGDASLA